MTTSHEHGLADPFTTDRGRACLGGIQALVRFPIAQLAIDAADGLDTAAFLSGIGDPPLDGLDTEVDRALSACPALDIVMRSAATEELCATAVMGSQLVSTQLDANKDGVLGVWYGTASGLDRSTGALRHAVLTGASRYGGAVALVGDDPAGAVSALPSASEVTLMGLRMPLLYPGDVQEVLDLARHAVALSRLSGLWSAMKIVTPVASGRGSADLALDRVVPMAPNPVVDGEPYHPTPTGSLVGGAATAQEREIEEVRMVIARRYGVVNDLNRPTTDPGRAWIGIVASGYTYHELLEALRRLGFESLESVEASGIRLLQLQLPFPLDPCVVRDAALGLDELVVVEERNTVIESTVKDALYGASNRPLVVGRHDHRGRPLIPAHGSLTADDLLPALHSRLARRLGDRLAPPAPRSRDRTIGAADRRRSGTSELAGDGLHDRSGPDGPGGEGGSSPSSVGQSRLEDVVSTTSGGTEGTTWIGLSPFLEREHVVQGLGGDSLTRSGQLAIQSAVAAGVDMTFDIPVGPAAGPAAMTGDHGPTGSSRFRQLTRFLLAQGVTEVVIATDDPTACDGDLPTSRHGGRTKVWSRTRTAEAERYLATVPGVTVLIHDRFVEVQADLPGQPGPIVVPVARLAIDHPSCDHCRGEIGLHGRARSIEGPHAAPSVTDPSSDDLELICTEGDCSGFMVIEPGPASASDEEVATVVVEAPPATFPAPGAGDGSDSIDIRLAGNSRTGVVIAARILGAAALLDGWHVRGLDQTRSDLGAAVTISDVRLSRVGPPPSNRIGRGQADTIIAFDLSVAASDETIAADADRRTALVASTTGETSRRSGGAGASSGPLGDDRRSRLDRTTVGEGRHVVDAVAMASALVGDATAAEVFLLGVAVQAGAVPVEGSAVERAIELSDVPVEPHRTAFRWGRQWVVDPQAVKWVLAGAIGPSTASPSLEVGEAKLPEALAAQLADLRLHPELHELLALLIADLVAYQSAAHAQRFVAFINKSVGAERFVDPESTALTEAIARGLHQLMAYRDEYEVARLLTGPRARALALALGGSGATVTWQLNPPLLRALGVGRTLSLRASRYRPLLSILAAGRRLRGTAIDPLGRSALRRAERRLIAEYRVAVDAALKGLSAANLDATVDLALAARSITGHEQLKLQRIERLRDRLRQGVIVSTDEQPPMGTTHRDRNRDGNDARPADPSGRAAPRDAVPVADSGAYERGVAVPPRIGHTPILPTPPARP